MKATLEITGKEAQGSDKAVLQLVYAEDGFPIMALKSKAFSALEVSAVAPVSEELSKLLDKIVLSRNFAPKIPEAPAFDTSAIDNLAFQKIDSAPVEVVAALALGGAPVKVGP